VRHAGNGAILLFACARHVVADLLEQRGAALVDGGSELDDFSSVQAHEDLLDSAAYGRRRRRI
jgi:hypothetical protein